jgi:hypothetical protein
METWYLATTSPITRKPGKCRVDGAAAHSQRDLGPCKTTDREVKLKTNNKFHPFKIRQIIKRAPRDINVIP